MQLKHSSSKHVQCKDLTPFTPPISRRRRLDAIRGHHAIEVERSGSKQGINKALSRLKTQRNKNKIIRVPQKDMNKARQQVRKKGMNVTITNLSKTRRREP